MIKHIVMWKIKDFAEGFTKQENLKTIKTELEKLPAIIPQIKKIEVGININPSEMSYDAVLYSEFENQADLDFYQNHPAHKKVSEFVAKVRTDRAVADYEG